MNETAQCTLNKYSTFPSNLAYGVITHLEKHQLANLHQPLAYPSPSQINPHRKYLHLHLH